MDRLLIVFLKWPQAGQVKTRLGKVIGHGAAAHVYRQLVQTVLAQLGDTPSADLAICFTPADRQDELKDWLTPLSPWPIRHWWAQTTGDLGARQQAAFEEAQRAGYRQAVIIGTDCLDITPGVLHASWQALDRVDWVFGPTHDGGYYLVGADPSISTPRIWQDIRWSCEDTLRDLITKLQAASHKHGLLEVLNDVDDYEDWISIKDRLLCTTMNGIALDQPIVFTPLYMQRVWGGRNLESQYHRSLPEDGVPFGESWEIVDREGEQSVVRGGELAGKSLGELWKDHRAEVFGERLKDHASERFPVLVKILDAQDRLSIQVHPPADVAPSLNGEPKTEMWYIAHATPEAKLYVGLSPDVDKDAFERGIAEGKTEEQVHAISPKQGEFIFIPSGRLHAIGAGLVIYEIQQNSDTTYRVFDWNRLGLDGTPRDLHIEESLKCIDFDDVEPGMDQPQGERLVSCEYFNIDEWTLEPNQRRDAAAEGDCAVVTVVEGTLHSGDQAFRPGDFFLVPANAADSVRQLTASDSACKVLVTTLP